MNQLGLFDDAPSRRMVPAEPFAPPAAQAAVVPTPAVPAARPGPPPSAAPALEEHLEYDADGRTVALCNVTLRNPHFGSWCKAGFWIRIERHFGWKPHRWMASVYLELPDEARTGWSEHEIFATQDEVAAEAAAMVLAARAMLEAAIRSEDVETPGRRRHRAAEAHAGALPDVQAAERKVDVLRGERDALDEDSSERPTAHRRYLSAKGEAADLRRRAVQAFCEAHGWREFV
jgi:hypothetical protein